MPTHRLVQDFPNSSYTSYHSIVILTPSPPPGYAEVCSISHSHDGPFRRQRGPMQISYLTEQSLHLQMSREWEWEW